MTGQSFKRLVICCDGTWNELDFAKRPVTNVVKLAQSISPVAGDGVQQVVFYDEGVGTLEGEELRGGTYGRGLTQNVMDAYTFLSFNYEPGDEIYIFGFSRGAYTARSLAGMIRNCGIVRRSNIGQVARALDLYMDRKNGPNSAKAKAFRERYAYEDWWMSRSSEEATAEANPKQRLTITYLGIWDTVGSKGIPNLVNLVIGQDEDHGFHDLELSSIVLRARHAVAIDERRVFFQPCLFDEAKLAQMQAEARSPIDARKASSDGNPYQQVWFPGDHGSVGGGGDLTGLSDHALSWVAEGARRNGASLEFDETFECVNYPVKLTREGDPAPGTGFVRFNPHLRDPLFNISKAYNDDRNAQKNFFGRMSARVAGAVLNADGPDRLEHRPALNQISPQALRYPLKAGKDGKGPAYREELADRLMRYARHDKLKVDALFATQEEGAAQ